MEILPDERTSHQKNIQISSFSGATCACMHEDNAQITHVDQYINPILVLNYCTRTCNEDYSGYVTVNAGTENLVQYISVPRLILL